MKLILVALAFFLSVQVDTAIAKSAFVSIDGMAYNQICGADASGKTQCLNYNSAPAVIPDSVMGLGTAFSNDYASCGYEQGSDEVKCWALEPSDSDIEGLNRPEAYRAFFKRVKPSSIRMSAANACGLRTTDGALECIVPGWPFGDPNTIHMTPQNPIGDIAVGSMRVCWTEVSGPKKESAIYCLNSNYDKTTVPLSIPGVNQLVIGDSYLCARSKTEAKCWSDIDGEVSLPIEAATAKQWSADSSNLCLLTQDLRVACVNTEDGSLATAIFGRTVPSQYATPNPAIEKIWTSDAKGCVLHNGEFSCWTWWNSTVDSIPLEHKAIDVFGSGYEPCVLLTNRQVVCGTGSNDRSQTLPGPERVKALLAPYGRNWWNEKGLTPRRSDIPSYRSIRAIAMNPSGQMCIIGVETNSTSGVDSVRCYSYDGIINAVPEGLRNPTNIAASSTQACAGTDDGMFCWGEPYAGDPVPRTSSAPKKIVMSYRHGCLIDNFGLACWGDLNSYDLQIPPGLEALGRVVDVAVTASRTCAVLDDTTIQCWGVDSERTGMPPALSGALSIAASDDAFCVTTAPKAPNQDGLHCWGAYTSLPK